MAFRLIQFSLFLIPLAFFTGTKDHFLIKETLTLLFLLAGTGFFLTGIFEKKLKFSLNTASIAILAFLFAELLSIFNAKFPELAVNTFSLHLCFFFVYIFSLSLDSKHTETILNTILITGLIAGGYGVFQHFGYDFVNWISSYTGRPSSSFGNPNFFAGYIIILIPIALTFFFKSMGFKKYLWLILFVIFTIDLIFNKTRGAWIASAVSLVYLLSVLFIKNKKLILTASIIVVLLSALLGLYEFTKYRGINLYSQSPSVAERLFKWQAAIEMIKEHPFIGTGAGNLKVNFALYQAKVKEKTNFRLRGTSESNVHNEFLQIFAETGILGLLSFLLIFIFYFFTLLKKENNDTLSLSVSAGVLAFLVFCLTNFPLRIMPTAITLFALMGLSTNNFQPKADQPRAGKFEINTNKNTNWSIRSVIFIMYFFVIWKFAITPFIADSYRKTADDASNMNDLNKAVNYYEKSISMDKAHSERSAFDLGEIYRKTGRIDDA
ncbi:MAG: O-antigen ligase family protein, partial [Elusimicrobia bacterium]|nr:O-antigen ligase family protein [Elusimicrobiota bacterium]